MIIECICLFIETVLLCFALSLVSVCLVLLVSVHEEK